MKRLLFAATMLATLLVSCMKSEIEVVTVIPSSEEFTASFDDATRTELDGTAVVWNENDLLTIFTKTSHNRKYEIKSLSTDCRTATFSYVGFTGTDGTKITTNYALYPYDAEATLANGVITTKWASEQTYDAETGNLSYALMTAASETTNFTFANAGALLRFKLSKIVPDDFTLRGIKLTSATQNIAGEITIDLNGNKRAIVTDNGVDNIYLDAIDTEITLDVQEFYVAMPAMSFNKGDLSVTFMFDEGNKEFALPAFELAQGSIKNIDYTIKDAEEFTGSTPGDTPTNNEIWYTNGSTTEATIPYRTDVFGANILSNTYDAEKECWVIKFDGDVTKIGDEAFSGCTSLTSVTIPDSVTEIGNGAFHFCTSLTSVTIPDSVTEIGNVAFHFCTSLTSVTIPDGVTTIGEDAFSNCGGLKSFTIPNSVTTIGAHAFSSCSGLKSFTIPNSVTTIGAYAFYYCSSLTSVNIPDSVTTIGNEAFSNCSGLTSVTIPDSVTTIGLGTFYGCSGLTSVTIPDSVTTIGGSAFTFCSGLTSITIPDSVTSIEEGAFNYCTSLTSVAIGNGVTTIGDSAFSYCSGLKEFKGKFASVDGRCLVVDEKLISFAQCGLTEYTIHDGVTSIGDYAFAYCSGLTSITIPDGVTSIGDYAFERCTSLTSITIPDSVTSIGEGAFSGCDSLTSITIPDSVTSIEAWAFYYCSSLTNVYCEATTPPTGDSSMFGENAPDRKIYVPRNSVEAYKSASGWSEYADSIVAYDFENGKVVVSNEIWYTNGSTTEATTPYKTDAFGVNIVSNTYDAEKECWVIKFDGEITKIGNRAFKDIGNLASITIPDSVTSIGEYAFLNCDSLTSVTIPDSVTTIGERAFINCSQLQEFKGKFASDDGRCLIQYGTLIAFAPAELTEYAIPDSVTTIGQTAFWGCNSLTSVTIGNGVTSIVGNPFCGCDNLQEFKGKFASSDGRCLIVNGQLCSFAPGGLTGYNIPDSVTTIGINAFYYCPSLTSVTIPDSVTTIDGSAFALCSGLTSVTIPDGVTTIGSGAFSNCSGLTSVTIPDSVTTIGSEAFAGCSGLTSVTIPDSVTSIGDWALSGCDSLTSVTICKGVTEIGDWAFSGCDSLTSITIPDSVTEIGEYAFNNCSSLKEVYCKPTTPPMGVYNTFDSNASGRKIYVPRNSVEAYKSAEYWSEYAEDIVGYDF